MENQKRDQQFKRETGYHECQLIAIGDRARRVRFHNPEMFDAILDEAFKSFYASVCTMNDAPIPKKEKRVKAI